MNTTRIHIVESEEGDWVRIVAVTYDELDVDHKWPVHTLLFDNHSPGVDDVSCMFEKMGFKVIRRETPEGDEELCDQYNPEDYK